MVRLGHQVAGRPLGANLHRLAEQLLQRHGAPLGGTLRHREEPLQFPGWQVGVPQRCVGLTGKRGC